MRKSLKIIGIVILLFVLFIGSIFTSIVFMNGELQTNTVEETRAKFGEFDNDQILKKVELRGLKISILKTFGIVASAFKSKNNKNKLTKAGRFSNIAYVFSLLNDVTIYSIAYKSDGLIVTGLMVTPKAEGKYPCIIYNRGGRLDIGRLGFRQVNKYFSFLAEQGYVVIASNYRGNGGSEGKEELGGADVNDVMNLIPVLSEVSVADTSKIGLMGHSRGGTMVYKALQNKDIFQTAIVIAGSTNKYTTIRNRPGMEKYGYAEIIPDYYEKKDEILRDRSVVFWPEKLSTVPLLILHGTKDWRVNHEQAIELVTKLDSLEYPYQFISFEDDDHDLSNHRKEYIQIITDWFNKYLRDLKPYDEKDKKVIVRNKE